MVSSTGWLKLIRITADISILSEESLHKLKGDEKVRKKHSKSKSPFKKIKYVILAVCFGVFVFSSLKIVKTIKNSHDKKELFSFLFSMLKDGPEKAITDQLEAVASNFEILNDGSEKCKKGIDPRLRGSKSRSALHWSSLAGCLNEVQFLIEKGMDVNSIQDDKRDTPLHLASLDGRLEVVKYLIEKGADVNAKNRRGATPLHRASRSDHLKTVEYLVEKGANVNAQERHGYTALHNAQSVEVASFLIKKGADVNIKFNPKGGIVYTPLLYYKAGNPKGYPKIISLLIEKGADVNAQIWRGETALHNTRNAEVASILIKKGANVNARSETGFTPLHRASRDGDLEVVKLLLEKGANVNAKSKYGNTALYWANKEKHLKVASLLVQKGAKTHLVNKKR